MGEKKVEIIGDATRRDTNGGGRKSHVTCDPTINVCEAAAKEKKTIWWLRCQVDLFSSSFVVGCQSGGTCDRRVTAPFCHHRHHFRDILAESDYRRHPHWKQVRRRSTSRRRKGGKMPVVFPCGRYLRYCDFFCSVPLKRASGASDASFYGPQSSSRDLGTLRNVLRNYTEL